MKKQKAIPFYLRVAQTIWRRIMEELYQPGKLLPPARELENDFGVSDITIRHALDLLVKEGTIARKRGIGTVVTQTKEKAA
jgi:GntR family transcriptional regulator